MKKRLTGVALLAGAVLVGCGAEESASVAAPAVELDTLEKKVSYLIGYNSLAELVNQGVDLEADAYIDGVRQYASGEESLFSQEESQQLFADFQQQLQAAAQAEFDKLASENAAASEAFLLENGKKDGVVTTESGLQYKVVVEGEGEKPTIDSTVQVHYEGRLLNEDVFDSSIGRGTPVEFGLTQVIPGWTEALQLMSEGATWELYIPSELPYGPNGSRNIGPNEALIFQVQLLQANFVAEAVSEE